LILHTNVCRQRYWRPPRTARCALGSWEKRGGVTLLGGGGGMSRAACLPLLHRTTCLWYTSRHLLLRRHPAHLRRREGGGVTLRIARELLLLLKSCSAHLRGRGVSGREGEGAVTVTRRIARELVLLLRANSRLGSTNSADFAKSLRRRSDCYL
jgi:hypothetical protein